MQSPAFLAADSVASGAVPLAAAPASRGSLRLCCWLKPPRILMFATVLSTLVTAGCEQGQPGASSAPGLNVILISMDTTRADHLACYGHPRINTPHIDRLAAEGTLFTQCTTPVPITLPSHSSMLTGTYPFVHKVRDNGGYQLHADNLTLAEVLRDAGYLTVAQVGAFVLNHEFGLEQGFAVYRDVGFTAAGTLSQRALTEIKAEEVTAGAIQLLQQAQGRRFFLFVHYFDPHQPYEPPPRFAAQYVSRYMGEIAYTDEQIGRLLTAVEQAGLDDQTLIILVSDHGEGLGQHQEPTHGYFVYDTTLLVPLIFRCPGRIPAGNRIAAQVRTIDIAPTVLAILGLPPLPAAQGADLSALMRGEPSASELDAYAETFSPCDVGFSQLRALRSGSWKYIHAAPPELYNLGTDPQETEDRAPSLPQRVAGMRARLHELLAGAPRVVDAGQARREISAGERRALEALGYLGGGPGKVAENLQNDELALFEPIGLNPREHAQELRLVTEAVALVQSGQHARVEEIIRELLAQAGERSKGFVWAHAHLAGALAAQGKLEEALEHFELAVQASPGDGQMYTMQGIVLQALGRSDEAVAAFRHALTLEPVFAITHLNLGSALASAGDVEAAIEQYQLAVRKDPREMRGYMSLARLLAESGRQEEALKVLDRALQTARETGDPKAVRQLQALRRRYERKESPPPNP